MMGFLGGFFMERSQIRLPQVPYESVRLMSIEPLRIRLLLTDNQTHEFLYQSDLEITAALIAWCITSKLRLESEGLLRGFLSRRSE